jgi:hypothetical protein
MSARDGKGRLDQRITELLRSLPAPARTESEWEAQVRSILLRLDASAPSDAGSDLLQPPFPEPAPEQTPEHAVHDGAATVARSSRAPRREPASRRPAFSWLLASVVALAAAALLVIRVRAPESPGKPAEASPVAEAVSAPRAEAPLAVAPPVETPATEHEVELEPPAPAKPAPEGKGRAVARATRPSAPRAPAGLQGPAPRTSAPAELEPDPRLKPADGRQPLVDRPSQGALTAALDKVLPGARSCLAGETAAVPAEIVFGSDGSVLRVNLGPGVEPGPARCVRGALGRARVEPFSRPSWSLRSTIRSP